MLNLYKNVFIGNEEDSNRLIDDCSWSFVHCAKEPWHRKLVGYSGRALASSHPNYLYIIKDNEIALNIVDVPTYVEKYHDSQVQILKAALEFADKENNKGQKLLFNCNKGFSRGPSIAMLYLAHIGYFNNINFSETVIAFIKMFPEYEPKEAIFKNVEYSFNLFVDIDDN